MDFKRPLLFLYKTQETYIFLRKLDTFKFNILHKYSIKIAKKLFNYGQKWSFSDASGY